jgi:hypothetical protein
MKNKTKKKMKMKIKLKKKKETFQCLDKLKPLLGEREVKEAKLRNQLILSRLI